MLFLRCFLLTGRLSFGRPAITLGLVLFALYSAQGQEARPVFWEAENPAIRADATVKEDNMASGEKYVTQGKAYLPLVTLPLPLGESFTVWVRARGYNICLKAVSDTQGQTELKWLYHPDLTQWTWYSMGTYPRANLGSKILLIRGPGDAEASGLDAIILSTDSTFDPSAKSAEDLQKLTVQQP